MGGSNACDPALLELFRAELDTHLPVLSRGLLALEKGCADRNELEAMMRAAHSIKGAARIVGVDAAVRVAHVMEDCFSAAQAQRVALTSEAVDVLLQGVDALQRICLASADSTLDEPALQALLERITAIRDNRSTLPAAQRIQEVPAPAGAVEVVTHAAPEYCIALPAVVDAAAAEALRAKLSEMLRHQPTRIRVDFNQAQHLSAAALAMLASFARALAQAEAPPTIEAQGASGQMEILLRTTGLDGTFMRRG